jgi:DNA modification methylase
VSYRILEGDCLEALATLEAGSVQTCITSPPYWGLRDYGTATWEGGDPECAHRVGGQVEQTVRGGGEETLRGTGVRPGVDASRCLDCGATRIDSQLGLEPAPEQYVANMVEVFREVRRVLRDDGTLWLNLGDSYAGGGGYSPDSPSNAPDVATLRGAPGSQVAGARIKGTRTPSGLKPKDLVGIPWMVARALRDPYYTGRIRDERDRIWLAAMIDAEGCMFIHRRKAGQHNGQGYYRKNDSFGAGLEVASTDRAIVERCLAIVGKGSISEQSPEKNPRRKQTIYRWNLRTNECREVIREVYPYLVAKQHEARLVCGCPSSGKDATAAWEALKAIHQGGERDVDFPAPASMFEPGWYLRSDIIWAKPSPMPESVTDRPTKAHEFLFLLSKSPRYYYDADAIREEADCDRLRGPALHPDTVSTNGNDGLSRRPLDEESSSPVRKRHPPKVSGDRKELHGPTYSRHRVSVPGGQSLTGRSGRNKRSVWEVTTQPFPGAHFATFPPKLIEPCVLAGSAEGTTVLDPFAGAGTTGLVACRHNRDFIGIELNPEYAQMARNRIHDDAPLLNVEAA